VTGQWFSQVTLVSSTNKTDRHDIAEILLKVALNTISPNVVLDILDIQKVGYNLVKVGYNLVKVGMLTSSAIDHRFNPRSGKTKDYKIRICCFSIKYKKQRSKSKAGWLGMCQS
jgi:hypothetical protein